MKNRALIVLLIIFVIAILLSLFITQQSQKNVALSEKEIPATEQAENKVLSAYAQQTGSVRIMALPSGRSGITIINAPSTESEGKSIHAPQVADKASNNVSGLDVASSTQTEDKPQVGITRIGKQPTPKESQEMNSRGIVLY
jgi:type II secretory pathway pseudopilin PulG